MSAALIAIFWSLVGKLGARFFADIVEAGMDEWAKKTPNEFDDKIAAAFHKAWDSDVK